RPLADARCLTSHGHAVLSVQSARVSLHRSNVREVGVLGSTCRRGWNNSVGISSGPGFTEAEWPAVASWGTYRSCYRTQEDKVWDTDYIVASLRHRPRQYVPQMAASANLN